ncbi:DUF2789 domain-containing protein [Flocculibacter collagenilyticus]|uniref:DUF2789 domain-containing protein n=1 Tax=Flocculibacter collagenilyticus TaxID=2744479 RepID=UPI0018F470E6|nr:DUF2789 domain-containing protein [Flocculibacter collagenilyticus]
MDTFTHDIPHLFQQLGMEHDADSIKEFCKNHRLPNGVAIEDASFWNPSQAAFLRESKLEDADWAESVDTLDTMLR